ncbi:MAG: hypothetical protein JW727_05940 [Candidatus Aenigmarchaeota archaeon]|nr:hypothetical protein [Candidatus Aenigmarchaeota archaeon]
MIASEEIPGLIVNRRQFNKCLQKIMSYEGPAVGIDWGARDAEEIIAQIASDPNIKEPRIADEMRVQLSRTVTSKYYPELYSAADELSQGILIMDPDSEFSMSFRYGHKRQDLDPDLIFGQRYKNYFAPGIGKYADRILKNAAEEGRRKDRRAVEEYLTGAEGDLASGHLDGIGPVSNYVLKALKREILSPEEAQDWADRLTTYSDIGHICARDSLENLRGGIGQELAERYELTRVRSD